MLCPTCTGKTRIAKSSKGDSPTIAKGYQGLNVTRRYHVCCSRRCGASFWTIEMLETDFDQLKVPPGLFRKEGTVRP